MEVRDDVDVSVGVAKNLNMLATEVGPAVKTFTHDFLRNYGCAVLATKLLSVVLAKEISASMVSSTNAAATH